MNIVLGYSAVKVAENHRGFKTICCLCFHSFESTKIIYINIPPSAETLGMCNLKLSQQWHWTTHTWKFNVVYSGRRLL